mmetsp:Transcript_11473/g.70539  ORF Transcript_11473/g.70539 Transcript_11473/m.70539 type:complete len:106 (+) Transcript_11473:1594-1911(+)
MLNKSIVFLRIIEFCFPLLCEANSSRVLSFQPNQFIHRERKLARLFARTLSTISTNLFQLSEETGSSTFLIPGSCTSAHIYSEFALSNDTTVTKGLVLVTRFDCR